MNECKLSEINWTKAAVFCRGETAVTTGQSFDCFVGVDRGSLWVLEEELPLDLVVGDFDSVTVERTSVDSKNVRDNLSKPSQKRMIQIWNWLS